MIRWLPTASALVVKLAVVMPAVVLRAPVPSTVEPSIKVTVPVGSATAVLPGGLTITVVENVTAWPLTDGLVEEFAVDTIVSAGLTICVSRSEVLLRKLVSPPYLAVMV